MENYINSSVELHLFFVRIMKEHAIFLEASFQQVNVDFIKAADMFKVQFEEILEESIEIASGKVRAKMLECGELVTPYTLKAEEMTQHLTGIAINTCLTQSLNHMGSGCGCDQDQEQAAAINVLNQKALKLLEGFISFKEGILEEVACCNMYTSNYPLLIQHILREARLYQSYLMELQRKGSLSGTSMLKQEQFWNQIMMEHALFIRGLLDPTENELIGTANKFAGEYALLLEEARGKVEKQSHSTVDFKSARGCKVERKQFSTTDFEPARAGMGDKNNFSMEELTAKSKEVTCRYRDFKAAGTKGISECKITSVILPLLADHVLREANHYLRLLEEA